MKKIIALFLTVVMVIAFSACSKEKEIQVVSSFGSVITDEKSESDINSVYINEYYDAVTKELKKADYYIALSEKEYSTITFDGVNATSEDTSVKIEEGKVTITTKGYYVLTGNFEGTVFIEAADDEKVYLSLNNINITAKDGPAIYEKSCDKLIISLEPGTDNYLEDSEEYTAYSEADEDAPTATVFCKDDLSLNGSGTLSVTGNYLDGIVTKDDLVITGGVYSVKAADDAILGRDSITVTDASITLNAGAHGFKTTNDDEEKGNAYLLGGVIDITSKEDGANIINSLVVENAEINVKAGDDGIHADKSLIINSGVINISESYEGLESLNITINGGDILVNSKDDGINASNGKASGGEGGFFGGMQGNRFDKGNRGENNQNGSTQADTSSTPLITINGGNVCVLSNGDGLDANGSIEMNGGYVFVSGSTDSGNNATDYDGSFLMNGGLVIACGSSGMYQSISKGSSANVIDYISSSEIAAGTHCILKMGSEEILSFDIPKKCNAIMLAGDVLTKDTEYSLYIGNTENKVTAKESDGSSMGGFGNRGQNAFGDRGQMRPSEGFDGEMPEGTTPPEGMTPPDGFDKGWPSGQKWKNNNSEENGRKPSSDI